MKQFYNDFGFILSFLIMCLIIQMIFGDKVQFYFLLLTLFSMLILNTEKTVNMLQNNFTLKK